MWFGEIPPFASAKRDALVLVALDRCSPPLKRRPSLLVSRAQTAGREVSWRSTRALRTVQSYPKSNPSCLWMLLAFGSYRKATGLYL